MSESKILFNVTIQVETQVTEEWLQWMKNKHIPDVMATGMFESYQINRVIKDEEGGITYAVQYVCQDMKTLHQYQIKYAQKLQAEHTQRYQGKFVAFRTLMEILDQGHTEQG